MSKRKKKTEEEIKEEKEAEGYQKTGFFSKWPFGLKATIIKYWFFGAICFFVFMGLGLYVESNIDLALVAGLIGGAIFDIACYNILAIIDYDNKVNSWVFFRKEKKWYSIPINVLYNIVLFIAFIYTIYYFKLWTKTETNWFLREPLSQALLLTLYDFIFISIKNFIVDTVKNAKAKKKGE